MLLEIYYTPTSAIIADALAKTYEVVSLETASEEFKQWRDEIALRNLHQMEIVVALIYGLGDGSDE